MSKSRDKGRIAGPFVPLLATTLDSRAWKAMSHGARSLYVALKRQVPKQRNIAYLSYRQAEKELGRAGKTQTGVWFAELQHYGFIVLHAHGSLGVDGKGKAPHWRLTELGQTSRASAGGLFEPPTNDFLKWDGTPFKAPQRGSKRPLWERKSQKPRPVDGTLCPVVENTAVPWTGHSKPKVSRGAVHRDAAACPVVQDITSLTTTVDSGPASPTPKELSEDSLRAPSPASDAPYVREFGERYFYIAHAFGLRGEQISDEFDAWLEDMEGVPPDGDNDYAVWTERCEKIAEESWQ